MKRHLNMIDLSDAPEALKILESSFEVTHSAPNQKLLRETIEHFDCFLTPWASALTPK
jgi:hypothetical protein